MLWNSRNQHDTQLMVATDTSQSHMQATFLLDTSGSMSAIEYDTEGGFNVFLR